jgi:glycosyltransferase involved in cell wall biosynthesis
VRILHVLGKLDRGGAETWLVQTLRHLDRSKYQFDFLVHADGPGAYDEEVKAMGARIIPCLSPSNPAKFARNFLHVLREYGPYDCVHSHVHHYSGYVLTLAKLAGVKTRICHSHCDTRVAERQRGAARMAYRVAMTELLKKSSTAGLAVSERAARSLFGEDWSKDPRWRVSHIGIDLAPFADAVDREAVRRELGIAHDVFVVGHVGRFVPVKNHVFLMDVAARVCAIEPNALFVFAGDGPLRISMEEKAAALGISERSRFLGIRRDVPRLMKGLFDVFLFPSLSEGFPVALMEAQASGLYCVAADNISTEADIFPDLVKRLPLSEGPDEWARAILQRKGAVNNSRSLEAMQNFSIDAAVNRLCGVYDNG